MSESKQTHSPLPWTQHTFLIKSKHGDFVTHCGMGNLPPSRSSESEANARFIVRAVNSHEALLAACKAALEDRSEYNGPCDHDPEYDVDCLQCEIRKAIALAEKEG